MNTKLNILYILLKAHPADSSYNEHALALYRDNNVTICTFFRREEDIPDSIKVFEGNNTIVGFLQTIRAALAAGRYDIIHAHSSHVGLMFLIGSFPFWRKFLPRTIFTVHSSFPQYKLRHRLMLLPIFTLFKCVICCGKESHDSFPSIYRWLAGNRLKAIANGVDLARVDRTTEKKPRLQSEVFTVISVARLEPVKNLVTLVRAFAEANNPSWRLLLVGAGSERHRLETEIERFRLSDHVHMTGLIEREQVYHLLREADVFVSTSIGEGMPIAVLEAMACSCPVILSDIPSHREIAFSTDFIPLIPANSPYAWAAAISRFQQLSSEKRLALGKLCRDHVERHFSLKHMLDQYCKVYNEIISEAELHSRPICSE